MRFFVIFLSLFFVLNAQEIVSNGDVLVNGKELSSQTVIKQGDTIETKSNSSVRFNVAKDAFFAKGNSKFKLDSVGSRRVLNVINGGVMAVFGGGNHGISTPNMTAGIRGTGTYTLVKKNKTYFCTCYGETDVDAHGKIQRLKSHHHKMLWITPTMVKSTQDMQGHNDDELRVLESMVGRKVPFNL
jgi:hypothetical protein